MLQSPEDWVGVAIAMVLAITLIRILIHMTKMAIWGVGALVLAMMLSTLRPSWLPQELLLPGFDQGDTTSQGWQRWLDPGNWRTLFGLGAESLSLAQIHQLNNAQIHERLLQQTSWLPSPLIEADLVHMNRSELEMLSSLLGQLGQGTEAWVPGEVASTYEKWERQMAMLRLPNWRDWAPFSTTSVEEASLVAENLGETPQFDADLVEAPPAEEDLVEAPLTIEDLAEVPLTVEDLAEVPLTVEDLAEVPLAEEDLEEAPLAAGGLEGAPLTAEDLEEAPPTAEE